jgi:hypothetical protein
VVTMVTGVLVVVVVVVTHQSVSLSSRRAA